MYRRRAVALLVVVGMVLAFAAVRPSVAVAQDTNWEHIFDFTASASPLGWQTGAQTGGLFLGYYSASGFRDTCTSSGDGSYSGVDLYYDLISGSTITAIEYTIERSLGTGSGDLEDFAYSDDPSPSGRFFREPLVGGNVTIYKPVSIPGGIPLRIALSVGYQNTANQCATIGGSLLVRKIKFYGYGINPYPSPTPTATRTSTTAPTSVVTRTPQAFGTVDRRPACSPTPGPTRTSYLMQRTAARGIGWYDYTTTPRATLSNNNPGLITATPNQTALALITPTAGIITATPYWTPTRTLTPTSQTFFITSSPIPIEDCSRFGSNTIPLASVQQLGTCRKGSNGECVVTCIVVIPEFSIGVPEIVRGLLNGVLSATLTEENTTLSTAGRQVCITWIAFDFSLLGLNMTTFVSIFLSVMAISYTLSTFMGRS
jgi:hypothetical protein